MATIVRFADLLVNTLAEPPCEIFYGINAKTVPNASLVMGYTRSGPNMRNQRHFHPNAGAAQYKIKGSDKLFSGPDHDITEVPSRGDGYIYIPKGEIHGAIGMGESIELVFCYPGVASLEEAGIVYMEPRWQAPADSEATA
ncbi:hypothetical protein IV417_01095 [Alphaproteobacteria bacterium KMM 3653]|uniref:Uncharacterized protein n=1 Tax=Harenicola maris TaxID=2841044 RepID=A0AAP2CQS2_9RHOB|nr:hypothetical protein [Harenicola maris]